MLSQISHTPFIGRFIQFCSDKQREHPRPSKSPYQKRPLRKETFSALNCENVESFLSDYMDDILDRSSITTLQGHLRICPDCQDTLLQNINFDHIRQLASNFDCALCANDRRENSEVCEKLCARLENSRQLLMRKRHWRTCGTKFML